MKVSVIVPVYNTEIYLRKCLESLVHQTMHDFEIIIVNDGSTDSCSTIIAEYIQKYPFIKAFNKQNGGMSSARNVGLDYATGESELAADAVSVQEQQVITDTTSEVSQAADYVLNTNTKRFHYPDCQSVSDMKESNKQYYQGSRDDLINQGYKACGNCRP